MKFQYFWKLQTSVFFLYKLNIWCTVQNKALLNICWNIIQFPFNHVDVRSFHRRQSKYGLILTKPSVHRFSDWHFNLDFSWNFARIGGKVLFCPSTLTLNGGCQLFIVNCVQRVCLVTKVSVNLSYVITKVYTCMQARVSFPVKR